MSDKKPPFVLSADKFDAELAAEQPRRAAALHVPMSPDPLNKPLGAASDAELLSQIDDNTPSVFDVPAEIIPDGMVYEWKAAEVLGMPHRQQGSVLEAERNGWKSVPASRHPGFWTPKDYDGPILVQGLQLMELPDHLAYNRHRMNYLMAKQRRGEAERSLSVAPAGTGPRDHPQVRPQVRTTREAMPIE
jgi:hypothetical protein